MPQSVSKKEITAKLEATPPGGRLLYKLSPTFGGQFAILEHNAYAGEKGEKSYLLRLGKDEVAAYAGKPFFAHDKAKKVADWVAERAPTEVSEEMLKAS